MTGTPDCREHGPMVLRPASRQTTEQRWCGTWYDCTAHRCLTSVLDPSPELVAQLAEQAKPLPVQGSLFPTHDLPALAASRG